MSSPRKLRLAIIGFGPRALGATEALVARLTEKKITAEIDIYDPFRRPGTGPNFDPDQSEYCILNIPVRVVDYDPPEFLAPHIDPFPEWSSTRFQPDDFPPRSDLGLYLNERFDALRRAAAETIPIKRAECKITGLDRHQGAWRITDGTKQYGPFDEVLLTQGQPETSPDPQLKRWIDHAAENGLELLPAYPANTLIAAGESWTDKAVAVRGLGLSTLDVIRLLTLGLGGRFVDGRYKPSGLEPKRIMPFSLNGRAPAAKPATNVLDQRFDPTDAEVELFRAGLAASVHKEPDAALRAICDALVPPAVRILSELKTPATEKDVRDWLDVERSDPGAQENLGTVESLKSDIEVAHGRTPPPVGYVIGQLWRKLQDDLRQCFNQNQHKIDTASAIIGLGEGFKRFSYGPPVSAAEELLTLIADGIVSVCIVDDPAIGLTKSGWQLIEGDDVMSAPIMVDSVLPSPALENVLDPLVSQCVAAGFMKPISDGLGARTLPDGQLVGETGDPLSGLTMLGRLTLGSVIAVDGLDDCFGPSALRWSEGVIERTTAFAG